MFAVGVVGAAAWSVVAGHTPGELPALDLLSVTIHLVAAALWIGPLAVVTLTALTAGWRRAESDERRDARRCDLHPHQRQWKK